MGSPFSCMHFGLFGLERVSGEREDVVFFMVSNDETEDSVILARMKLLCYFGGFCIIM